MKRGHFIFLFALLAISLLYSPTNQNPSITYLGCGGSNSGGGGGASTDTNTDNEPETPTPETTPSQECFEPLQQSPPTYITSEKLSDKPCPSEEEQTEFTDATTTTIYHCVSYKETFEENARYVTNSYLEIYNGVEECSQGGSGNFFFQDKRGDSVYLCVETKPLSEAGEELNSATIVEGDCPSGFEETSTIELTVSKTLSHCIASYSANSKIETRLQATEEPEEKNCCVEGCLDLSQDQCKAAAYCAMSSSGSCTASACENGGGIPRAIQLELCKGEIFSLALDKNGKPIGLSDNNLQGELINTGSIGNGRCTTHHFQIDGITNLNCPQVDGKFARASKPDDLSPLDFSITVGRCGVYSSDLECDASEKNILPRFPNRCEDGALGAQTESKSNCNLEEEEPNNNFESANELENIESCFSPYGEYFEGEITISGEIKSLEDVDVYKIIGDFRKGNSYYFRLEWSEDPSFISSLSQPIVVVFNEGSELISGGKILAYEEFVFRENYESIFIAIATRPAEDFEGDYSLRIIKNSEGNTVLVNEQRILLDFRGSDERITEIPPLEDSWLNEYYPGELEKIKNKIKEKVIEDYADFNVEIYTSDGVLPQEPYSTVYFGGYQPLGIVGSAGSGDKYNSKLDDDTTVYIESMEVTKDYNPNVEQITTAISNTASHEIGHLLGLDHTSSETVDDLMNVVGTVYNALNVNNEFKTSPLDSSIFPIGKQNAPNLLELAVGRK